ncbi:Glycosyltransferase involved in cell wall bisynthesis [Pseudoalteromonas denitrificans DSM 6059]|uniref:Glycosyltransferase involved in cell wall bisynthesis n=2 Tax=Pseudoalteromonas TaxID=53246 RepID=A0A1I1EPR5_9GAMM|nr:Glycosyltransferase involved in cell wall bisynthesis [Pseudoalteromonas denitrificans DSM 6059]
MVNVMQLVQHFKIGGLEKMVFELSSKSNHSQTTHVVSLEGDCDDVLKQWPQLKLLSHVDCLDKQPGISFKIVDQLVALIDEHQIDIIHSHHIGPMLYGACAIKKRRHVKHITTVHDAWYLNGWRYRLLTRLLYKLTPITVVADAVAVADEVYKKVDFKAQEIVINGIDSVEFSPINMQFARYQLNLPRTAKLIGCAARIEEGKGHCKLLEQLINLPDDFHLVFAGSGSKLKEYQSLAKQLGIEKRVHWLGNVQQMTTFYSCLDLFCLFSQREGLPLSILEAMSCNKPVVASNVGGVSEVVTKGLGILLEFNQSQLLPQAILDALNLKKENAIREAAIKQGCSRIMAAQYDALYDSVLV